MFVLSVVRAFFRKPYMKKLDKPSNGLQGKIAKHQTKLSVTEQKCSENQAD